MHKLLSIIRDDIAEGQFETDMHGMLLYVDKLMQGFDQLSMPSRFPEGKAGVLLCALLLMESETCADPAELDKIIQGLEQILSTTRSALTEKKITLSEFDSPFMNIRNEGLHMYEAVRAIQEYRGAPEDFQLVLSRFWLHGDSLGYFEPALKAEIHKKGWVVTDKDSLPGRSSVWRFKSA